MNAFVTEFYNTFQTFSIENFSRKYFGKIYREYAKGHPNLDKIVIGINHFIRLIPMIGFMTVMPFQPAVNCALMFGGSLFYRTTIEPLCPLRFTLLSCAGAAAFEIAKLNAFSTISLVPFALYAVAVIHTSYYAKVCCSTK
jgi:hypothetical protein